MCWPAGNLSRILYTRTALLLCVPACVASGYSARWRPLKEKRKNSINHRQFIWCVHHFNFPHPVKITWQIPWFTFPQTSHVKFLGFPSVEQLFVLLCAFTPFFSVRLLFSRTIWSSCPGRCSLCGYWGVGNFSGETHASFAFSNKRSFWCALMACAWEFAIAEENKCPLSSSDWW